MLIPRQIARLEKTGMSWGSKNQRIWEERYEKARQFYQNCGNLDVPNSYVSASGKQLGNWVRTQKIVAKAGKLSQRQICLLVEIGMVFENNMAAQKSGQRTEKAVRATT